MQNLKKILKKYLFSLFLFYRHLRYRLVVVFILSVLAKILPMLEQVNGDGSGALEQMGNLSFLVDALSYLTFDMILTVVMMTTLFFFTLKGTVKFIEQYKKVVYWQYFIRNIREDNITSLAKFS
jgi:hypothetical protein